MFRKGSSFPWEQGGKWSTVGFSGGKWAQSPLISPVQILPHLWTSTTSPHPLPFFMQLAAGTSSWAPAAKVILTLTPAGLPSYSAHHEDPGLGRSDCTPVNDLAKNAVEFMSCHKGAHKVLQTVIAHCPRTTAHYFWIKEMLLSPLYRNVRHRKLYVNFLNGHRNQ